MYDTAKPYIDNIIKIIRTTWETPYVSVDKGVIEKKFDFREFPPHVDGIGTKGFFHWQQRTFENAVLDAFAMNSNDLCVRSALPYAITNHIFLPRDDHEAIRLIMTSLARECKKRKVALVGGETAIHNTMEGMEISITMLGMVKRSCKNKFLPGDVIVGIASNGLHSNGFTRVREIFGNTNTHRKEFTAPTRIYSDEASLCKGKFEIHGMAHITGGAFTKLREFLYDADALIGRNHALQPQPIFEELYDRGCSDEEMYTTCNCGVGFIVSAYRPVADKIVRAIPAADVIGRVVKGSGKIKIESAFSCRMVEL